MADCKGPMWVRLLVYRALWKIKTREKIALVKIAEDLGFSPSIVYRWWNMQTEPALWCVARLIRRYPYIANYFWNVSEGDYDITEEEVRHEIEREKKEYDRPCHRCGGNKKSNTKRSQPWVSWEQRREQSRSGTLKRRPKRTGPSTRATDAGDDGSNEDPR